MAETENIEMQLLGPESKTTKQRKPITSKEKRTYKTTRRVVVGICTLTVWIMLIVRTSTLVAMPILKSIAKDYCSLNSTSTIDIISMVYSSSSEYIQRLSVIMMIILTVLQWPAHGYLFHYLYKFFSRKHPALCMWQSHKWISFIWRNWCKGALITLCLIVLTIASVLTILGDVMTLVTEETSLNCEYLPLHAHQIITYAYYATTFFTYILEVAERWLMVCFTALVGAMWHEGHVERTKSIKSGRPNSTEMTQRKVQTQQRAKRNLQTQTNGTQEPPKPTEGTQEPPDSTEGGTQEPPNPTEGTQEPPKPTEGIQKPPDSTECGTQEPPKPTGSIQKPPNKTKGSKKSPNQTDNAQCNADEINAYKEEFKLLVDDVKPVYKIFRSFFVFQWLVHVYLLFTQIVHLLHPWIKEGTDTFQTNDVTSKVLFYGKSAAVVFYALALIIAYVCGLKMNSYRRRYIRKAGITHENLLRYDRENKSIFTPRVPGTGLSISLESPGYMLGVVLTMFGLVGALLAM